MTSPRKLDILVLSDVYFPRVNGVSTSIRTLARGLTRRGHRVTLVAPEYGVDSPGDAFEIVRLPARPVVLDPEDRLISRPALAGAASALATRHWDAIHVQTPFRAHRLGVRIARAIGAPVVETYHTHFEAYAAHYVPWLPASALRAATRAITRRLCAEADHVVAPTAQIAQLLEGYRVKTPISVIPTGIDLEELARGDGGRLRAALGIAPGQPTLVTISRIAHEKNIAFLLEVARRLLPEFPELRFVVSGEGPAAASLREQSAALGLGAVVRFLGNLAREDALADCYRAADVFVFASPTETQGLVLIEAMACGVPIVSTAQMGTAAVLEGARCAGIAPAEPAAFAAQVATLLRDRSLRLAMREAGPCEALRWRADTAMIEPMEKLYLKLGRQPARHARVARLDPDLG